MKNKNILFLIFLFCIINLSCNRNSDIREVKQRESDFTEYRPYIKEATWKYYSYSICSVKPFIPKVEDYYIHPALYELRTHGIALLDSIIQVCFIRSFNSKRYPCISLQDSIVVGVKISDTTAIYIKYNTELYDIRVELPENWFNSDQQNKVKNFIMKYNQLVPTWLLSEGKNRVAF